MENKPSENFEIVSISRSQSAVSLHVAPLPKAVMFGCAPFLVLDNKKSLATTIVSARFSTEDKTPVTNTLTIQVVFSFKGGLPVVSGKDNQIEIRNYDNLLSIFEITIGTFRGILFEWLKGTELQKPLPIINVEDFLKDLRISFSDCNA